MGEEISDAAGEPFAFGSRVWAAPVAGDGKREGGPGEEGEGGGELEFGLPEGGCGFDLLG